MGARGDGGARARPRPCAGSGVTLHRVLVVSPLAGTLPLLRGCFHGSNTIGILRLVWQD